MSKKLLTSPKGIAGFIYVNKPDTKFKEEGEYRVPLLLPAKSAEAKQLMKEIDAAMASSLAQAKKDNPKKARSIEACEDKPYKPELDENDKRTGNIVFTFKMKASGTSRRTGKDFTMRPALFDAFGKAIDPEKIKIGKGSTIRVSYEFFEFWTAKLGAGVSLRLAGVQVIELVEYTGADASAHGFEEEEGFDMSEALTDSDDDEEEEESDDEEDEDSEEASEDDESDDEDDSEEEEDEEEAPPARRKGSKKVAPKATKKAAKPAKAAKAVKGKKSSKSSSDDEF